MTDIATLGLKIDSTQAVAASAALDKLAASAKPATAAAVNLEKAAAGASSGHAALAKSAALSGNQIAELGHIARSTFGTMAAGGSVFQALGYEANRLVSVLTIGPQGVGGTLKAIGGLLAGLLNPTVLVVGGFTALAGASYLAYSSIQRTEAEFANLAERGNTTIKVLHELEAVAAFKGIDFATFTKGMERFAELSLDARDHIGSMADLFRANNVQVGSLDDNLMRAADMIRNARTEADKYRLIQQLGLPATREWVQYLSQGSAGLRSARDEAVKFGDAADEKLVAKARAFDEAWNKAWKDFADGGKRAFLSILDSFTWLDTKANDLLNKIPGRAQNLLRNAMYGMYGPGMSQAEANAFYDATGAGKRKTSGTVDPNVLRNNIALEQQRIGLLGSLATVQDAIHAKENEINLAGLAGVKIRQDQVEALKRIAEFQAESAKIQKSAQYGIVDPTRAAANAKLELQTLIDDKTVRSADDYAAAVAVITKRLKEMSDQAAVARSPFEQLTRYAIDGMNATKQFDTFATQSMGHLENGLADFITGTKSAKEAFRTMAQSILRDLTQMIIRMQITGPLAKALGGAFGFMGGGGAAAAGGGPIANGFFAGAHSGAIVGSEATFMRAANPAIFAGAPRFHTGGVAGDEVPIIAKKGEGVFTPAQMKALSPAGGGGAPVVNVTHNNTYTFTGVEPGMEARMRAYIDQGDQRSVRQSVDAVAKVSSNTPAYRAPFK